MGASGSGVLVDWTRSTVDCGPNIALRTFARSLPPKPGIVAAVVAGCSSDTSLRPG